MFAEIAAVKSRPPRSGPATASTVSERRWRTWHGSRLGSCISARTSSPPMTSAFEGKWNQRTCRAGAVRLRVTKGLVLLLQRLPDIFDGFYYGILCRYSISCYRKHVRQVSKYSAAVIPVLPVDIIRHREIVRSRLSGCWVQIMRPINMTIATCHLPSP